MTNNKKELSKEEYSALLSALQKRFEENMKRHPDMKWDNVQARLESNIYKILPLFEMERTGGEPDVLDYNAEIGEYTFYDCSPETPATRKGACYDSDALNSRKKNKPQKNIVDMAAEMGTQILTEEQYRYLQTFGEFDLKTSSWIKTDETIRRLGGALFCDRRYGRVFVYHNGADSYYSSRGFRTCFSL